MIKETETMAEQRFDRGAGRRVRWIGMLAGTVLVSALLLGAANRASAAWTYPPGPGYVNWSIKTTWGPTELHPGEEGWFTLSVTNMGTVPTSGVVKVVDHLPPGVSIPPNQAIQGEGWICFGSTTVICNTGRPVEPGYTYNVDRRIQFPVSVSPAASGTHTNTATVSGGGGEAQSDSDSIDFGNGPEQFGFVPSSLQSDVFSAARPATGPVVSQAGTHPFDMRVDFDFNEMHGYAEGNPEAPYTKPIGRVRDVENILPLGLFGNPEATPKCDPEQLLGEARNPYEASGCPSDTQVGYLRVLTSNGFAEHGWGNFTDFPRVAVYNLVPPKGVAADFGFQIGIFFVGHIFAGIDGSHNYAIRAYSPFITDTLAVRGVQATFWGVPGDPAHDYYRAYPGQPDYTLPEYGASVAPPYRPFLTMPMDCGVENGPFYINADSWNHPGEYLPLQVGGSDVNVTGCEDQRVRFHPAISLQPTDRHASQPTGLDVHLKVPQRNQTVEYPNELYAQNGSLHGIDTPPIKKVVVTFPPGMTISASAAQGLGSCTLAQIGLGNNNPVACPDSSQYGTLTLHTPLLPADNPMRGFIYIAKQNENPFNNFLSMYFVIQEPQRGLLVKIPGKIELDPVSGQIKATFDELPQFPVSDMQLTFKGGVRSALVNPATCGTKEINATFYSWAHPNEPIPVSSSYGVTQKADGSPCVNNLAERPFKAQMSAGTVNPNAGSYSPFVFRMTRSDDDQELSQIGVNLPGGLTSKIAGLTQCSDEAIEAAANPARTGTEEKNSPSCPASSLIGTTDVGSGVGVPLTYIPGKIYLAGPYKGAPLSIAVITPILAGPYDLGVIVVRSKIEVDPESTEIHVLSDPFPQIYQGIPVRIRDIRLKIDRPEMMLNPTNCNQKQITAHLTGAGGDVNSTADDTAADLSERFQVANCSSLGFAPKLSFKLKGGTERGDHPGFSATLATNPGDANLSHVAVTLPHSEFLDQAHIKTVCTRVQFRAEECPAGSIYGYAKAWTPLLDNPVEGPVILRSSSHTLPDLVMALHGTINVYVVGRIDSINGGIRTTFETIPDQPVSKFTLTMKGGGKGLLQNSTDLCKTNAPAVALIDGQNGKTADQSPHLANGCASSARKARHHRAKRHKRHARHARKAG